MLSTESESGEVAESDQLARVSFMESQSTKVSTNSSPRDHTELLLKTELAEDAETSESLILTGLVKMALTSSMKSSLSILSTRLLEEMEELTGLLALSTNTEKTEVLPQLERDTEDSELEDTEIIT